MSFNITEVLRTRCLETFFCKGPGSEHLRIAGHMVSIATDQLCLLQEENSHQHNVNEWRWLWSE